MYGDTTTMMGGLAGIYLPLLWDPIDCSSIPISVLYNGGSSWPHLELDDKAANVDLFVRSHND